MFCRDSASTSRTKFAQNVGELYYSGAMAGIYCFDITDKSTFQHVDQWMQKLSNSQYSKNSFLHFSLNSGSLSGDLVSFEELIPESSLLDPILGSENPILGSDNPILGSFSHDF